MKAKQNYIELQIKFMAFCENNEIDKKKYFINYADARNGKFAAIFEHGENETISFAGGGEFYSFDALIAWMDGYTAAKNLILFK